jgi:hypothetical protein
MPVATLELTGVKLAHMEIAAIPGVGLQSVLIQAVKPLTESGGTADAFVTTATEPDINEDTLHYVESYVPDHSGDNFLAHVTVGLGKLDDHRCQASSQ